MGLAEITEKFQYIFNWGIKTKEIRIFADYMQKHKFFLMLKF